MPPGRKQAQTIFEGLLNSKCFNGYIRATAGKLFYFENKIAIIRIEHDIGTHVFRTFSFAPDHFRRR